MKILIDGYNVINKWPLLVKAKKKSLEVAREELLNIIQKYCSYTGSEVVIIYDGGKEKSSIEEGNPTVIFSRKGESADTVIESLVYKMKDRSEIRVVSDDRIHGNLIIGMGGFMMSTSAFEKEMKGTGLKGTDLSIKNVKIH